MDVERPLSGGRQTKGVVRVGNTVRRPHSARSGFIARLLQHLEAQGFPGAPRYLGLDLENRDVFSYLEGEVPAELREFSGAQLTQAARLLRSFHDATVGFGGGEVVCHGDASPCNCVFLHGTPYAFIDFDEAGPGHRLDDVGYAAWLWLDIGNDEIAAEVQLGRLRRFFADYDDRHRYDPVAAVIAAQMRQVGRVDLPPEGRRWAEECLRWTRRLNRPR